MAGRTAGEAGVEPGAAVPALTEAAGLPGAGDPVILKHRQLEQVAMAALEAGRLLMETGAKSSVVKWGMQKVTAGLGAEQAHVRIGFASLSITVTHGVNTISRMIAVGEHGVNVRLNRAVRDLCQAAAAGGMTAGEVMAGLRGLGGRVLHQGWPARVLAAGAACAAFGALLGIDGIAFPVVLGAAMAGQGLRMVLTARHLNRFVVTAAVAFVAAVLAGLASSALGSQTVQTAMSSAVLMLVPGVPAISAQTDIMEGFPSTGSARVVTVAMILVFLTVGVAVAGLVTGGGAADVLVTGHSLAHHVLFGAVAAVGFGVLFNFGWSTLPWVAVAGGLALLVRTLGMDLGWSLEAASLVAAAAVAVFVEVLERPWSGLWGMGTALAVAGCIPMIPGSAAAHCIIGLLQLTAQAPLNADEVLVTTASAFLRVVFTIGALGAGLTIVRSLVGGRDLP